MTINTVAEYTKLIEETCPDQTDVLFRGQARDNPLLPALARERLTDDVLTTERSMLEELQRLSVPYLRLTPRTTWDWMAIAQHHGLPTRLLDWSENPFTSLWFAVHRPPLEGNHGVVWIFRPTRGDFAREFEKNKLECRRHMVFSPSHITERITTQGAWFTVHKCWSRHRQFDPLEQSEFAKKLTKIVIPANKFAHFRFHLDRYGVNHASVFPGLDGLCAHIKWKRCFLDDEGDKS
jgi:hypothetical protein